MFGNGKGLFGGNPLAVAPQQMPAAKADGRPSGARRIAGILGDVFLGLGGQQGVYGPMMARQREMEQQQAMAMQNAKMQREWENEDWRMQQDYERANREPPRPGSFEWYQSAAPQDRALYDMYNPVTVSTAQGPMNVPRAQLAPPAAPVGRLTPITEGATQQPMAAQQPQMIVTPRELDALVRRFGPQEVQARLDSGIVAVREN